MLHQDKSVGIGPTADFGWFLNDIQELSSYANESNNPGLKNSFTTWR